MSNIHFFSRPNCGLLYRVMHKSPAVVIVQKVTEQCTVCNFVCFLVIESTVTFVNF